MAPVTISLIIYGLILLSGAYFGIKAGSKISCIMGIASGMLVFLGLFLAQTNARIGYGVLTATSGLLVVVFLIRLIKTSKFMPSGMLLSVSLIALIISLCQFKGVH